MTLFPPDSIMNSRREKLNKPIHVNDRAFEKAVLDSPVPVLVDFWAPWCAPCHALSPSLDRLAAEYAGRLVVAEINTDRNPRWATHFQVRGVPTMLFITGGRVVHAQIGPLAYPALRHAVEHILQSSG